VEQGAEGADALEAAVEADVGDREVRFQETLAGAQEPPLADEVLGLDGDGVRLVLVDDDA